MAATQEPPSTPPAPGGQPCANCGAAMAPDQRYCLSCGARRGDPRVPSVIATEAAAPPEPSRPADVSPLAAVIGIALLGGMLLIGVLIGRSTGNDNSNPAPVVQVGQQSTTTTTAGGTAPGTTTGGAAAIASEWPAGTDGFTIQLNTVSKDGATPESVDAAKQAAVADGASDAAVLDSDLYSSLPPGNYVIYSGVYTDRKSAETALKGLRKNFKDATVVRVAADSGSSTGQTSQGGAPAPAPPVVAPNGQTVPGTGGEDEVPPVGGSK